MRGNIKSPRGTRRNTLDRRFGTVAKIHRNRPAVVARVGECAGKCQRFAFVDIHHRHGAEIEPGRHVGHMQNGIVVGGRSRAVGDSKSGGVVAIVGWRVAEGITRTRTNNTAIFIDNIPPRRERLRHRIQIVAG